MSERVELELLRRLEAMTVERDEARADIETLKLHVETLREAWQGASEAVTKLGEQLNASEADVRAQEYQTRVVALALADKIARTDAVNRLLSKNGCDCECDHACEDDHEEDCERCLACRIDAALNRKKDEA